MIHLNRISGLAKPARAPSLIHRLRGGADRRLPLSYQLKEGPRRRYIPMDLDNPWEGDDDMEDLLAVLLIGGRDLLAIAEGRGPAFKDAEDCARASLGLVRVAKDSTPAEAGRCLEAAATALEWGRAALPE